MKVEKMLKFLSKLPKDAELYLEKEIRDGNKIFDSDFYFKKIENYGQKSYLKEEIKYLDKNEDPIKYSITIEGDLF